MEADSYASVYAFSQPPIKITIERNSKDQNWGRGREGKGERTEGRQEGTNERTM